MARRGENIYHRKDGRWEGRYIEGRKPDGKPKFKSIYGKQYRDVKLRLVMAKAELGGCQESMKIYGNGSLRDWMDYWLEQEVSSRIKESTRINYRRIIKKHLEPALGAQDIQKLTQEQIKHAIKKMEETLAASTIQNIFHQLKTILEAACIQGVIARNPCQGLHPPRVEKKEVRVLTGNEQKKLKREVMRTGELEYLLCLYTGLRVGEVCALRWEDVDFSNNILHVRHSIQRISCSLDEKNMKTKLVVGTPKSVSSIREIPLPRFLQDILKKRWKKAHAAGCKKEDYLFPGEKTECRDPRTLQHRIKKLCESLGIFGVHMHTLRHSFATRCLERKIGYEVVSALLGHSSPQITLRYYAHCMFEEKRRSMEELANAV